MEKNESREDTSIVLNERGVKAVKNRHHWIFSGAVSHIPRLENGSMAAVNSPKGEHLGYAYFNQKCSITGRMVSFDATPPLEAIKQHFKQACKMRRRLIPDGFNAYRIVNAEGDGLPGWIVDKYADVYVIQVSTLGMEKIKDHLIELLLEECSVRSIYEKSISSSRKEEGLGPSIGFLWGERIETVKIREQDAEYLISLEESQKTGFFLDQRIMRQLIKPLAINKRVLDCFSYTGGFAVSALKGGARHVDLVELSSAANQIARQNLLLNGFNEKQFQILTENCFDYLKNCTAEYDFSILDPPAFAKKKKDVPQAIKAYGEINRLAIQKTLPHGLLLTCSCSTYINSDLFQTIIFKAAKESGRNARIIQRHNQAPDHPVSIFHPETEYLKGLLLYIL